MKLYILRRLDDTDYDENDGFVIRAVNAEEARRLASIYQGTENNYPKRSPWLQSTLSSCKTLHTDGESGVILRDFRAG